MPSHRLLSFSKSARSAPRVADMKSANGAVFTPSKNTPWSAAIFSTENATENTPIEPVTVAGSAKIFSEAVAIQYAPLAAVAPKDDTTFAFLESSSTSRRIDSLANALPPGLSMRRTTAFMEASSPSARKVREIFRLRRARARRFRLSRPL